MFIHCLLRERIPLSGYVCFQPTDSCSIFLYARTSLDILRIIHYVLVRSDECRMGMGDAYILFYSNTWSFNL